MPLPLIVPIAVGVAGLFGAGKTVKAVINSKEADKLNDAASYIIKEKFAWTPHAFYHNAEHPQSKHVEE